MLSSLSLLGPRPVLTGSRDVDGAVCTEAMNIGKHAGLMYLELHAGEHGVAPAGPVAKRPPKAAPPGVKRPRLNSPEVNKPKD
jgi:hypothetical protein